jgi:hypothetical protein
VCASESDDSEAPGFDIAKLAMAIEELRRKQRELLDRFRDILARALLADLNTPAGLKALAQRASRVAEAHEAVDLRTKRFAQILARAGSEQDWLEAICSLAAGRPIKDWADPDVGRTALELNGLTEQFGQIEAEIAATSPDGLHLQKASDGLLATLSKQKLDPLQQRAALLYALKKLGGAQKIERAA